MSDERKKEERERARHGMPHVEQGRVLEEARERDRSRKEELAVEVAGDRARRDSAGQAVKRSAR